MPFVKDRWILRSAALTLFICVATSHAGPPSNNALDFDGVDDYVEMGDPLDFNGPFTVEAWIYARSGLNGGRFLSKRDGVTGYEMDINDNGVQTRLRFTFQGSVRASADFAPYMNTWTHVAGTWEGPNATGEIDLYINGSLVGTGNRTKDLPASGTNFLLGMRFGAVSGYFDGRVDEVRVWSARLDEATIAAWMHSHITPAHPDFGALEAAWRLDEGTGQSAQSQVNSPMMDGVLGATTGADMTDPTWVASDVVPNRSVSVSELKSLYEAAE